jgi:trk system potassium uptake protein TrkA
MRIVIAGAGAVGTFLAEDLSANGHRVLILDQNPETRSHFAPGSSIEFLQADACEADALQAAQLDTADVVVAATGDDEDNLVISLLAKQEFAVPRVIARVNHPKNHWLFNESWGVDVSVSTPHLLSALVEEAVSVGSVVHLLNFKNGDVRLIEVTLDAKSPAKNAMLMTLPLPREATVVAIVRDGHVITPRTDTRLSDGDEVLLLVGNHTEDEVRRLLVGP